MAAYAQEKLTARGASSGMVGGVITIAEYLDSEGRPLRVRLGLASQAEPAQPRPGEVRVRLESDDGIRGSLPLSMLATVMRRYGKPLDGDASASAHADEGQALDLGGGCRLAILRYRALVDSSGRDYLVWSEPGHEPIAALSNGIAAALRHLAERLGQRAP